MTDMTGGPLAGSNLAGTLWKTAYQNGIGREVEMHHSANACAYYRLAAQFHLRFQGKTPSRWEPTSGATAFSAAYAAMFPAQWCWSCNRACDAGPRYRKAIW